MRLDLFVCSRLHRNAGRLVLVAAVVIVARPTVSTIVLAVTAVAVVVLAIAAHGVVAAVASADATALLVGIQLVILVVAVIVATSAAEIEEPAAEDK